MLSNDLTDTTQSFAKVDKENAELNDKVEELEDDIERLNGEVARVGLLSFYCIIGKGIKCFLYSIKVVGGILHTSQQSSQLPFRRPFAAMDQSGI